MPGRERPWKVKGQDFECANGKAEKTERNILKHVQEKIFKE